jgi:hypothetical protein
LRERVHAEGFLVHVLAAGQERLAADFEDDAQESVVQERVCDHCGHTHVDRRRHAVSLTRSIPMPAWR